MSMGILMAWAVLALILLALLTAATRPDRFRVERSLAIPAPVEALRPYLEDFHAWAAWSPWEKIDPSMQRSYSGAPAGKGAVYAWRGTGKAGAGRMELTETTPDRITIRIDFFQPFAASNTVEFALQPEDGGTRVTWAMFGPSPFVSRLLGLVFNMDRLIGRDFEAGLGNLRDAVAPGQPAR